MHNARTEDRLLRTIKNANNFDFACIYGLTNFKISNIYDKKPKQEKTNSSLIVKNLFLII